MDDKTTREKLLFDIKTCIHNINTYLGNAKIFKEYNNNRLVQDAV